MQNRKTVMSKIQGANQKTVGQAPTGRNGKQKYLNTDEYKQRIYQRRLKNSSMLVGGSTNLHENVANGNVPMYETVKRVQSRGLQFSATNSSAVDSHRAKSQLG